MKCSAPLTPQINDKQLMKSHVLNIDMQINPHVIQLFVWEKMKSPSAHEKRNFTEGDIAKGEAEPYGEKKVILQLF